MGDALASLAKYGRFVLAGGVFIGILLPDLAAWLRPLVTPVVMAMLTAALLRIDWLALGRYARRPGLALAFAVWQLLASPLLVWLIAAWLRLPPAMIVAMVLSAAAPPITSAPVFAQLLNLDAPLTVVGVVITTILLPFTLVPLAGWLLGSVIELDTSQFFLRAVAVIGIPFSIAAVLRRSLPAGFLQRNASHVDGVNVLLLIVFAIGIMDGVSAYVTDHPATVALWLLGACALSVFLHASGFLVFRWAGKVLALSIAICSGNRNMGLMLVATTGLVGAEFALFVALAQIPMYFVPMILAPVARKQ